MFSTMTRLSNYNLPTSLAGAQLNTMGARGPIPILGLEGDHNIFSIWD